MTTTDDDEDETVLGIEDTEEVLAWGRIEIGWRRRARVAPVIRKSDERKHEPLRYRGELERMRELWRAMVARCHNPRNVSYPKYGGRGIVVCEQWRRDFGVFVADVGMRPDVKIGRRCVYSIDRIDNNRGYEPGNVRWATGKEQQANRRPQPPRKLSLDLVQEIRGRHEHGEKFASIARRIGCHASLVRRICIGSAWKEHR